MPTVEENRNLWGNKHSWTNRGDEWSSAWGGPEKQWYGAILPRIKSYVPTGSIVEIACGYGRWTHYLKDLCRNLTVIDLSEDCIRSCKQRFSDCSHIEYHVNDGRSLDMVPESSVDFVFSFDSLVHADSSTMKAYLCQMKRILKQDGVAFLHHSNLGEYKFRYSPTRSVSMLERLLMMMVNFEPNLHWRDAGVDAGKVEAWAKECGLQCIQQEIVQWGTKRMFIDCMSTIVKSTSMRAQGNRIFRNPLFGQEARDLAQRAQPDISDVK